MARSVLSGLIQASISLDGRGTKPALVLTSSGTPANAKPVCVQLKPRPPGSFVNRKVRNMCPAQLLRLYALYVLILFSSRAM